MYKYIVPNYELHYINLRDYKTGLDHPSFSGKLKVENGKLG